MDRYSVRRPEIVASIESAITQGGGKILSHADAQSAPFEIRYLSPTGEDLQIVCYAFTANKYRQRGRPSDEHRFQIKYGSDFSRYHKLFHDPSRRVVTLMFGVHHELDLFVAVDPEMHNPTWFSRSIEFKTSELELVMSEGWHGWERERSAARRKEPMPLDNFQTEALLAFTPEHFLRYVEFERLASGLDAGERLLLIDRLGRPVGKARTNRSLIGHPLEQLLDLPAYEVLNVLQGSFRLLAAVRGFVAEYHLGAALASVPELSDIQSIDKDGKPDFSVVYADNLYRIECKNVLRRQTKKGPKVDFQKTRASKRDPCSRYYKRSQFEVLAACLHPITESWEFVYCPTKHMRAHEKCRRRLDHKVFVEGPYWTRDVVEALELSSS